MVSSPYYLEGIFWILVAATQALHKSIGCMTYQRYDASLVKANIPDVRWE